MKARGIMVLTSLWLLGACKAGGFPESPAANPGPPPPPTYPTVTTFTPSTPLNGLAANITIDRTANTLAQTNSGTVQIQFTGSANGLTNVRLTVVGVGGPPAANFTETFQAADLAIATPIPGQAPRTLLSGSKTFTDGSVRTLTVLDTFTADFNYMVLGSWEYALTSTAASAVGSNFVSGPATRSADIPLTGTANYSGVMFGRYADGATLSFATAEASATANFVNRQVAFSTTNTQITSQLTSSPTWQARTDLNLTGTLSYSPATNILTTLPGALSTVSGLTGESEARFYGPAAAEIGGTFFVKNAGNTQQLTGSFGLKQP
jgi:hypothetical protein